MKSRMLVSLLVIALAAAVIGGATMAWFTDEDVAAPVTFTAGTLAVDLDVSEIATEGITINNLNPGDVFDWDVTVKNVGTKNFKYGIYVCWLDTIGRDNDSLPEGQQALLSGKEGFGTNDLSEVMNFKVYATDAEGNATGEPLYEGQLPDKGPIGAYITDPEDDNAKFAPDAVQTFKIVAEFPTTAGNAYQGGKMDIVFGVMAWQATNDAPAPDLSDVVCPFEQPDEPGEPDGGNN